MGGFQKTQARDAHGHWMGSKGALLQAARKAMAAQKAARQAVKLSIAHAAALEGYTKYAAGINSKLWHSKLWHSKTDAAHTEQVKTINAMLDKMPTHNGTVFRNMDLTTAKKQDRYKVGAIITEKGFTSATTKRDTGFAGNTFFRIHSQTGKQVWDHSRHPKEREVLFKSGTKFKVLAVEHIPHKETTIIHMIEVAHKKK
jgi:hypothetical protein